MATAIRSGLLYAVSTVQTFFKDNGVTAKVDVGWKRRTHQDNQCSTGANRVVFTPSGDDGGAGGALTPPRFPGGRRVFDRDPLSTNPVRPIATIRELAGWNRKVLVSVWAVDLTNREDEQAQIEAVEGLLEWTVRAVHAAPGAFADAVFGDTQWTPPRERAFGLEVRVGLTFRHPIFDVPRDVVYPAAAAVARGPRPSPNDLAIGGDT